MVLYLRQEGRGIGLRTRSAPTSSRTGARHGPSERGARLPRRRAGLRGRRAHAPLPPRWSIPDPHQQPGEGGGPPTATGSRSSGGSPWASRRPRRTAITSRRSARRWATCSMSSSATGWSDRPRAGPARSGSSRDVSLAVVALQRRHREEPRSADRACDPLGWRGRRYARGPAVRILQVLFEDLRRPECGAALRTDGLRLVGTPCTARVPARGGSLSSFRERPR